MADLDLEVQGMRCTVKVTETVVRGKAFKLNTSNHWPNVLVTTAESVFCLGVFLTGGVSGDWVDAMLFGPILVGSGSTVTEGSRISAGGSGLFQNASADGYPCGVALDSASTANFRFIPIPLTVHAA